MWPIGFLLFNLLRFSSFLTLQTPLSLGILQARILEWVATPSSRGPSWRRDRTDQRLLHCRQILYHLSHQGSLTIWLFGKYSMDLSKRENLFSVEESRLRGPSYVKIQIQLWQSMKLGNIGHNAICGQKLYGEQCEVCPNWDLGTCAKSLQSGPTLCDPMDCTPPGSSVHGILQARILEWVAMPSFRGSSQSRGWTHVYYVSCIGRHVLYH